MRRDRTGTESAQALGTGIGRHRATAKSRAGRRGTLTLAWLSVFALAGLLTATSALAGFTRPFVSEFNGSDTPDGSLGSEAEKLAIRQSTGDVYVIASSQGLVDRFDASGNYLSQITGFPSFGGDPDLAVDNSAMASEGNLYVKPEFNPLFAYDASGTLLYQLDETPSGSFGDVCGTAVDSNGDLYLGDYTNSAIQKFDSSGSYLTTIALSFRPCDLAVDTDGTMYVIQWNNSLHKVAPDGTDLGVIDGQGPRAVNIDPLTHDVYSAHQTFVRQFDSSGMLLSEFGAGLLGNTRGVDINGSTDQVYVSTNPSGNSKVIIFGPLAIVPDVTTGDATDVTTTSATLNGSVDPAGGGDVINCYFEYGTSTSYGNTVPCGEALPIGMPIDVSADIGGLTQSTTYHFRLVAANEVGAVFGADQTFLTMGPPIVTSQPASDLTESSATLHAAINPAGFDTTCVFQYVDDATFQASGYDTAASMACTPADLGSGFTPVPASAMLTGLAPTTMYHFRAVATNEAGTTNGDDRTFLTRGAPFVVSQSASDITDTSATLSATIVPNGLATTCVFQYVDDATFQASGYDTAASVDCSPFNVGSNFSEHDTSASLIGLMPDTLYHFRVVPTNSAGTTNGDDMTFQTLLLFLYRADSFGSPGTEAGQFDTPVGVAVHQSSGAIYVADSGNARVQKFNNKAKFDAAWGWGVADGMEESEVCTSHCQAGIPGSGPGQFDNPRSIAVGNAPGPSMGKVFVGDWGNDTVLKFDADGDYLATIDGSKTPQGGFVDLRGVAVDADGHLWVVDGQNVNEFDAKGKFVQQWENPFGSDTRAIAVDSVNDAVYLTNGSGRTDRFSLLGEDQTTIDDSAGTALAVDPATGNLYVDHGSNVVIYGPAGNQLDELLTLGLTFDSQGIAFRTSNGKSDKPGTLYVSDATNDYVAIYVPQPAGPPFITAQLARYAGSTNETLEATIVPMGYKTTCTFQYVGDADFMASGYDNATTIPCTQDDLGKSFDYQQASATATGLTLGNTYHFHAVAMNSKGTTVGADQTFVAGPGAWAPFSRCPVDDPAMLATDGVNMISLCVANNSTHGSIQLGILPGTETGNSNLQGGLIGNLSTGEFTFISPAGGALIGDPVEVTVMNLSATATVQSAGTPTDFDLIAGLSIGVPILTLPAKIHLENDLVGPTCYIGSEMDPMVLHPANTNLDNAEASFDSFNPDGTIDPNGPLSAIVVSGAVQGDDTFAVPVAQGCNGLDDLINTLVGLPSPSGMNHLVLDDASSALVLPATGTTGQEFSEAWHTGFGQ